MEENRKVQYSKQKRKAMILDRAGLITGGAPPCTNFISANDNLIWELTGGYLTGNYNGAMLGPQL